MYKITIIIFIFVDSLSAADNGDGNNGNGNNVLLTADQIDFSNGWLAMAAFFASIVPLLASIYGIRKVMNLLGST